MANQEHLEILKQGVERWNQWRFEHTGIEVDLRRADLRRADLRYVRLRRADLRGANLRGADLRRADLRDSYFRADLEADLRRADLRDSHLNEADLRRADLSGADLRGADLRGAVIGWTVFGDVDLSVVNGLEAVKHAGPSTIGIDTIYRSYGNIPEAFLKGAGVDGTFITYIRSLIGRPIEYYSCFISYSSKDQDFAKRLHVDLQSNNVRCWFAPEDLKIGDKFWHRIDESIRIYDKLLVVLSEHSVQSDWVEREVMAALEKEKQGKIVLFPIMLDDAVKDCTAPWAADLRRQRHIGDFRGWKNHDDYQKAFERLLRDLKASA